MLIRAFPPGGTITSPIITTAINHQWRSVGGSWRNRSSSSPAVSEEMAGQFILLDWWYRVSGIGNTPIPRQTDGSMDR